MLVALFQRSKLKYLNAVMPMYTKKPNMGMMEYATFCWFPCVNGYFPLSCKYQLSAQGERKGEGETSDDKM